MNQHRHQHIKGPGHKTHQHGHHCHHHHSLEDLDSKQSKVGLVALISLMVMTLEYFYGQYTHSVALMSDALHMFSHGLALSLSFTIYTLLKVKKDLPEKTRYKVLNLGGLLSALVLVMVAIHLFFEAYEKWSHAHDVLYREAIIVAIIGLITNLISAFVLTRGHAHETDDLTFQGTFKHVVADAMTSVLAITGLFIGQATHLTWIDPSIGLLGGCVILKWGIELGKNSWREWQLH